MCVYGLAVDSATAPIVSLFILSNLRYFDKNATWSNEPSKLNAGRGILLAYIRNAGNCGKKICSRSPKHEHAWLFPFSEYYLFLFFFFQIVVLLFIFFVCRRFEISKNTLNNCPTDQLLIQTLIHSAIQPFIHLYNQPVFDGFGLYPS